MGRPVWPMKPLSQAGVIILSPPDRCMRTERVSKWVASEGAGFLLPDWEVIGQPGEEASTIHVACAKSQKTGHTIRIHSRFT